MPSWLRRAVHDPQSLAAQGVEDLAIVTGAAIGALDAVVRREEKWAGAWRQRLALVAAAGTARQAGRVEDEAELRDAVLLTRPGDDVGPAGRMLLAWRRLAGSPAEKLLTLMCIAFFQPITRAELSSFFGKEISGDLIGHLRGAKLIASGPRSPTPGAPYTYVTTKEFLLEFGLDTLRDLPDFEALEDAGLLSKEKLLAGDIMPGFSSPGGNNADADE
ncbi:SMC-Scp complex subunit ScpB [Mesorhizobium sp. M0514]|uniref:SMC-Scp complex subunit ScpB n=1 Tax=Mesorhizobium sp. M0514 TaxID=2956955 RepID=UPI003336C725